MPPTFTTLSNVSAGTSLSATLYNNNIGANGSLAYLYYALNPFFGTCADATAKTPVDVFWRQIFTQSVANATWTTISWDLLTFGSTFYDPTNTVFSPEYAGCTNNIDADINLLVCINTYWAVSGVGMRGIRFSFITNTNCNPVLNTSSTVTQKIMFNNQSQNVGESFTFTVPITVTSSSPSFTCRTEAYQSSGGALDLNESSIRIYKLPTN